MRILVVSSLKPTATANYLVRAFKAAGHDLLVCSDVPCALADVVVPGVLWLPNLIAERSFDPQLALFIEGGTMQLFPLGMESLGCLTAWYGIDTHMDYEKHIRIARLFDITFIAQKEYVGDLKSDGIHQVFWLPLAFEPSLNPEPCPPRIYDIAYVGSNNAGMHPVRHQLLQCLAINFPNMWQGMATPEEMGKIYAQSRIVFNKSVNNDLNMRYFEAMGAGAVLMTDRIRENGVDELFVRGMHFVEYDDEKSLVAAVRTLLSNPEETRRIGNAARDCVRIQHTYAHRAQELLRVAANCKKARAIRPEDYFPALIALKLPVAALGVVEDSFAWPQTSARLRLLGYFVRGLAVIARVAVSGIEAAFGRFKPRG